MTGYTEGRKTEYDVIHDLRAHGYLCIRAAGSKGAVDVAAFRADRAPLFVSVKRSDPLISPKERVALLEFAEEGVGLAVVATKPRRERLSYRRLTGAGPKDYVAWTPDGMEKP